MKGGACLNTVWIDFPCAEMDKIVAASFKIVPYKCKIVKLKAPFCCGFLFSCGKENNEWVIALFLSYYKV